MLQAGTLNFVEFGRVQGHHAWLTMQEPGLAVQDVTCYGSASLASAGLAPAVSRMP